MADLTERLSSHVSNALPPVTQRIVTGIIGDRPSTYAKTPLLWNAVYRELAWDAVSLPWDLPNANLRGFLDVVRDSAQILGFSITVPFKVAIVPLLDDLDPLARDIGAVNTVVRKGDGRLAGYNTDGQGAIDALTAVLPGQPVPFLPGLAGLNVLLIGAGGAARAVAFYIASHLGDRGSLRIVNRDAGKGRELAAAIRRSHKVGDGGGEDDLAGALAGADLVINATVKGQAGWRRAGDGGAFMLEPYSALASARPAVVPADRTLDRRASGGWFAASLTDIDHNNREARLAMASLNESAACFDLIYAPLETRFLADARLAGHLTMNGKWMNVAQAADAFVRRMCARELAAGGFSPDEAYRRVFEVMARVW